MRTDIATAEQTSSHDTDGYMGHPVVAAVREGNLPENEGQGFWLVLTLRSGKIIRGPSYRSADEIAEWGAVKIHVHEDCAGGEPRSWDQTFLLDDVLKAEIEW